MDSTYIMSIKKSDYFLITGDMVPSKNVTNAFNESGLGEFDELFKNSKEVLINLEAPITKSKNASLKAGPSLKVDIENTGVIAGVNASVACMANNHICDYGVSGLVDTVSFLEKSKIEPIGVVVNGLAFNHKLIEVNNKNIAIFNFCEEEFCTIDEKNQAILIDPCDNFNQINAVDADFKVIILHAGTEHFNLPNPWHRKISKYFIDVGADLVVSHHTHKVSGYEVYKNKFIYYGLGNFLFSNESAPESWNLGVFLKVDIESGKLNVESQAFKQLDKGSLIRKLNSSEGAVFSEYINDINATLGSAELYESAWHNYIQSNKVNYEAALYGMSRLERGIYRKFGLKLPTFEKRQKKLRFLNFISCSSHRFMLSSCLKKVKYNK